MAEPRQLSRQEVRRNLAGAERCGLLALGGIGVLIAGYYALLFPVVSLRSLYEFSFGCGE